MLSRGSHDPVATAPGSDTYQRATDMPLSSLKIRGAADCVLGKLAQNLSESAH